MWHPEDSPQDDDDSGESRPTRKKPLLSRAFAPFCCPGLHPLESRRKGCAITFGLEWRLVWPGQRSLGTASGHHSTQMDSSLPVLEVCAFHGGWTFFWSPPSTPLPRGRVEKVTSI